MRKASRSIVAFDSPTCSLSVMVAGRFGRPRELPFSSRCQVQQTRERARESALFVWRCAVQDGLTARLPPAVTHARSSFRTIGPPVRWFRTSGARKGNCESCSVSLFALYREVPLHRSRQVAADRESKPDSSRALRQSLVQLNKRLEDRLVLRWRNASASVADS